MAQVDRVSWAQSLLAALQLPVNSNNTRIIVGWETQEGGAGPQFGVKTNFANYNPLNTKRAATNPPSTNSGGGIQSYASWSQGLKATVDTFHDGNYPGIIAMLTTGDASPQHAASIIAGSPWGTKLPGLASLITGAADSSSGLIVPTLIAGSVAGLGGTGTPANLLGDPTSAFYVGDSENPDEDYWTAINQYAQEAQWYSFSDGESLYVADGNLLMAQTPAIVVHRADSRVIDLQMSYDDTSWMFAVTRRARSTVSRRATLSRTTTPTQATLKLVCEIDAVRGGDVVRLLDCGPGDGLWLAGEVRRSIFDPFSTITLVKAAMPLDALTGLTVGPDLAQAKTASKPGSGTVISAMLVEATKLNDDNYPYVWGGGHARAGYPDTGQAGGPGFNGVRTGFDCSGAVGAVLAAGNIVFTLGSGIPGDSGIIADLRSAGVLVSGVGHGNPEVTLYDNPGVHIFMSINGRFWGTEDGAGHLPSNGYGVGWIQDGQTGPGFTAYHLKPSLLLGYISGGSGSGAQGGVT